MDFEESFRATLREIRESKGISQEKLAELSELDRTYISLVERGKRVPLLTTMVKIAKGLGIPLSELIVGAEKKLR